MTNIKSTIIAATMTIGATVAAHGATDTGGDRISVTTPQGNTVTVTAMGRSIIRVTNTPASVSAPESRTTVLSPVTGVADIGDCDGCKTLSLPAGVKASLAGDGRLTIVGSQGVTLTDSGLRTVGAGENRVSITVSDKDAAWYGAGERGHRFNLAGDTLVMYNRQNYGYTAGDPRISQMNITMPLAVSSDGYAILFD